MNSDCVTNTSVGKKFFMAVTGFALVAFVIGHLLGNLTVYGGRTMLNDYAHHLENLAPVVWTARIVLLIMILGHIFLAINLSITNRRARPQGYAKKKNETTSISARTMGISGLIVLGFIVYHLLHFTFRTTHPEISNGVDPHGHRDAYKLLVLSFQDPKIVAIYIASLTLFFLHLRHGVWSLFQSLGFLGERSLAAVKTWGPLLALVLYLGYISIPLSCYFGLVKV